jgi:hypothetical protein
MLNWLTLLASLVVMTGGPSSACLGQRPDQQTPAEPAAKQETAKQETAKQETAKQETAKQETADFRVVVNHVRKEARLSGPEHVLLVVDIDNTLLAMDQNLGSDQWFNSQQGLLNDSPQSTALVAKDFAGLLRAQGLLFSLSRMHPPERDLPPFVKEIQEFGGPVMVLTSRGPDFRNAAQRELKRNGYDFADSAPKIAKTPRGRFMPFVPSDPKRYGLSAAEVERLRAPDWVTYSAGILMVAGQHKGFMLKTLLARSPHQVSTIVFVDDHKKHTERMHEAFANTEIKVVTFRYSREDGNVRQFESTNKEHVIRSWKTLEIATRHAFEPAK